MTDLVLPLKAEYFDAIKAGTKPEEFRLANDYWRKRLEGRTFDRIVLTKGYPKRGDTERRIVKPWRGSAKRLRTIATMGRFSTTLAIRSAPASGWGSDDGLVDSMDASPHAHADRHNRGDRQPRSQKRDVA